MAADRLAGKRVVVLGGTGGIGLAVAVAAAQAGAQLVVVSSQPARVEEARRTLGEGTEGYAINLTNEAEIRALFERIGAFDHLVYTAGETLLTGEITTTELAAVRQFFELRYFGVLAAVKYAAPLLRAGGSIVLTSGTASSRPGKGWGVVASVLGAMEALARALALELAPLRVNVVAPGVLRTNLWNNMSAADRAAFYAGVGQATPVGRVGEAEDVAQTYVYFMQQPFSTGQTLVVDGGAVLV